MPEISDSVILANHRQDRFQEPLIGCESRYPVLVRKGLLKSQEARGALGSWREYKLTDLGHQTLVAKHSNP